MGIRTDEEIISCILNGDIQDFRLLVERHQIMAYRTALSVTRYREDAQEVLQDAFLKAFSALNSFQGRSRFSTWLFRIVYYQALNHLEKIKHYQNKIELDENINTDNHPVADSFGRLVSEDRVLYIGKALDMLSAEDRTALNLYYLEEQPQPEIATTTGWSLTSTKQRIHRARTRLELALDKLLKIEKNNLL